jgi:hypothetical protein
VLLYKYTGLAKFNFYQIDGFFKPCLSEIKVKLTLLKNCQTFLEKSPSNTDIYEGMVVGIHSRDKDLVVNVMKGKQLTNVRASDLIS